MRKPAKAANFYFAAAAAAAAATAADAAAAAASAKFGEILDISHQNQLIAFKEN